MNPPKAAARIDARGTIRDGGTWVPAGGIAQFW